MLVAALQIQGLRATVVLEVRVDGVEFAVGLADGEPTDAGVEPDVENVGFFSEARAGVRASGGVLRLQLFGEQILGNAGVPGFRALAVKEVDDFFVEACVLDGLVALFTEEDSDGHTPDALAGDAPVGTRGDHVGDALFAPGRIPDHLVDLFNGELPVCGLAAVGAVDLGIERDEPLVSGAEDDGVVTAPAMRVTMLKRRVGHERTAAGEHIDNDGIGSPDFLAFEGRWLGFVPRGRIDEDTAGGIDACGGVEAVAHAGVEVVCTV